MVQPSFLSSVWIFTPAVKKESCEIDQKLLDDRINKVAQYALAYLAFTFILAVATAHIPGSRIFSFAINAMPFTIIPMFFIPFIDSAVAEKEADIKAVNEYLTKQKPSPSAVNRIQSRLRAAEMYIQNKGDVNKTYGTGTHLLTTLLGNSCAHPERFQVFKLLVDHGAKMTATANLFSTNFELAVSNKNPCFLEYVITNNKVRKEDFDDDEFQLWTNIGSAKAAQILKDFGFNPNTPNRYGITPLAYLLTLQEDRNMPRHEQAKALIASGAKLSTD